MGIWCRAKSKRKAGRAVSNQVSSSGMMKFLGQTESGSTESNESFSSTSQQHLSVSKSPLNLEVTPDAPTIDTERRKSEIEIGSKASLSKSDAEISVFTLNIISHNEEEEIEISSLLVNRDASGVVNKHLPILGRIVDVSHDRCSPS
ncbi:hypothetical protein TNCV_4594201 [Trichonephila clavipes]|uniref:Uncharacterized protein n=1 Tax=Trichonephila clavipes TaxID=2585209 RepID=A0A8X7BJQ9_TRICX|nr:hypothetical protein TNCV_4594201 [Trichonephila clavipes]